MPDQIREFHRAPTVAHAVELLQRSNPTAAPLVVGPRLPDAPFAGVEALVDLRDLALDYLRVDEDRLCIGAHTPLQALVDSPVVQALAGGIVSQAAKLAAHFGLRNLATLAGALDGIADGPPELMLALLALDARATVQGGAPQQLPLRSYNPTSSALLVEVSVALTPASAASLARVARTPLDQAIVAAVGVVAGQVVRVAVAGASPRPLLVQTTIDAAPAALCTRLADEAVRLADPAGDYRGSVEYRRAMTGVLAQRALENAFKQGANA